MSEKDFTEREFSDFKGFGGFGELPDDLRGAGSISVPGGTGFAYEGDVYGSVYGGGSVRAFVEPIPAGMGQQFSYAAINYLPRANAESFRSQRFFAYGSALLTPADTGSGIAEAFVDLFVDMSTLTPGSPQTNSSGPLIVPQGYAAVITGLRQWIGDASAFQKPDGQEDDVVWRITAGGTPLFAMGNFPVVISAMDNEAKLFAIANESTSIQLSVKNTLDVATDYNARNLPVQGVITGHWFPIDELDDIFRNR